jgi:GDP-L-fucose synthase
LVSAEGCVAATQFLLKAKRIWVAGHGGMVGSAIVRRLAEEDCEILTVGRGKVDLRRQEQVERWMARMRPDVVFLAAARVGGIYANDAYPAEFIYDNLAIQTHVIEAARRTGVQKLLFLGSSCIYPKLAPQPMAEQALLTGPLEPTNEWYAIAKIAGLKMVDAYRRQYGCDFISAMPTNLCGPGDDFDLKSSHVLPALIRKAHEAKLAGARTLEVWGSGRAMREFLHVDDCADASVFLMKSYSAEGHVNVGSGLDLSIADAARLVAEVVGFEGRLVFDASRPDGAPRKLMSAGRLRALGWAPKRALRDGVADAYQYYLERYAGTPARRAAAG